MKAMETALTTKQIHAQSYYFQESVAYYYFAFGFYPKMDEMRVLFIYATRRARFR